MVQAFYHLEKALGARSMRLKIPTLLKPLKPLLILQNHKVICHSKFCQIKSGFEDFSNTMALRTGGLSGIQKVIDSKEICTVELVPVCKFLVILHRFNL